MGNFNACHLPLLPPQSTPGGDGGSSAASAGGQGHQQELCFESAAAELVLLRRDKLLPLAQPEAALADAASLLERQEAPVLLNMLLTLRRVAIHHHSLLAGSLEDVVALLLECLHGGSEEVGQAAIMALVREACRGLEGLSLIMAPKLKKQSRRNSCLLQLAATKACRPPHPTPHYCSWTCSCHLATPCCATASSAWCRTIAACCPCSWPPAWAAHPPSATGRRRR